MTFGGRSATSGRHLSHGAGSSSTTLSSFGPVAVLTLTDIDRFAKRCPVEWNKGNELAMVAFAAEWNDPDTSIHRGIRSIRTVAPTITTRLTGEMSWC